MQILIDKNNLIIGYATIGNIENGINIEIIPQEVQNKPMSYKYVEGKFIYDSNFIDKNVQTELLQKEMQKIKTWFSETDYKALKVFRGNWSITDSRYLSYVEEYNLKKAHYDEIEILLKGMIQYASISRSA